jgi:hypothetical protein
MTWIRYASAAAVAAATLGGCASTTVEPVAAVDEATIKTFKVEDISVTASTDTPDEVTRNVVAELRRAVDTCAVGPTPIDLNVKLDHYEEANAAAAILIGDQTELSGSVNLLDRGSKKRIGSYYVSAIKSGGGIIAAVAMSGSAEHLPRQFAENVCSDVFLNKLPPDPNATGTPPATKQK